MLAGRAVWKESVGMPIDERQNFYATTGADRLAALTEVVESYAKPWRESSNAVIPQDWYA